MTDEASEEGNFWSALRTFGESIGDVSDRLLQGLMASEETQLGTSAEQQTLVELEMSQMNDDYDDAEESVGGHDEWSPDGELVNHRKHGANELYDITQQTHNALQSRGDNASKLSEGIDRLESKARSVREQAIELRQRREAQSPGWLGGCSCAIL